MSLSRGASQKSGGGGLGSRKGSALSLKDMVSGHYFPLKDIVTISNTISIKILICHHGQTFIWSSFRFVIKAFVDQVLRRGSSRRELFTTVRFSMVVFNDDFQWWFSMIIFNDAFQWLVSMMTMLMVMTVQMQMMVRWGRGFVSITPRLWGLLRRRIAFTPCIALHLRLSYPDDEHYENDDNDNDFSFS